MAREPGDPGEPSESSESRAVAAFRARFGAAPSVVASAPGRVNLIGEHVDYADGVVLPFAIRQRTAVAMSPAHASEVASLDLGRAASVRSPGDFEALPRGHADAWVNGLMGPLRALADAGVPLPPVRAVVASEVPIGAGLSSSAALATAMAGAALRLSGARMDDRALARRLQEAERRFTGTPCGIMDMMTAIAGRPGHALRLDCRSLAIDAVAIPDSLAIVVVDSGVRHALAESAYAARRAEVEQAARRLGVATLRDATREQVERADLPPTLRRRARHVVCEIDRVERAVTALRAGDLPEIGRRIDESHRSLRDDFQVSVPEIDRIVDAALGADRGVLGARLVGGGFGGSVLVLVDASRERAVLERLRALALDAPPRSLRVVGAGGGYTSRTVEDEP